MSAGLGRQITDRGSEREGHYCPMGTETGSGRPLLDRLGVRPGARVSVIGIRDPAFLDEIRARGVDLSVRPRSDSDVMFVQIDGPDGIGRLKDLEPFIKRSGAIWAVFPKGRSDFREVDLIAAGPAAGLVDNKVVRFSDTQTALRFVVPLRRR